METVTIPKVEYEKLKKLEELDFDLIRQFAGSLGTESCLEFGSAGAEMRESEWFRGVVGLFTSDHPDSFASLISFSTLLAMLILPLYSLI